VRNVSPQVHLVAAPALDYEEIEEYLKEVGGEGWLDRIRSGEDGSDPQNLIEFAGRFCYRSWEPGLNPNVTKVRTDQADYLRNILASLHGSVLEHAQFTFALHNVSRVFTHELVRHRVGTAISQESLRFVRLDDLPVWFPQWAREDDEVYERALKLIGQMEDFQIWMARHFGLDDGSRTFKYKKERTSFMRRFAPEGVATGMVWSANIRILRHTIEARTAKGAEEEIRLVFGRIGEIMRQECPLLFGDYIVNEDGEWIPGWRKV
jgi:thymidylate synthase (FAD)